MKSEWTWQPKNPMPDSVLVVASRTEYAPEGWDLVVNLLNPTLTKWVADPSALAISAKLEPEHHVVWSQTAWVDYKGLESFVHRQIEWLSSLTELIMPTIVLRHNAYRILPSQDLPLDWFEVELMVDKVRSASPLGADVFPELSRQLGLKDL